VRPWRDALWRLPDWATIGAVALTLYLLTGGYSLQSVDTDAASVPAWVLVRTGSLDLAAAPGLLPPEALSNPWYVETPNGVFSNLLPGVIAYSVPAYAFANLVGIDSFWAPGVVSAALATATAVALMATTLAALGLAQWTVRGATLFFALGTATWTVSADAQWPHGIDQLIIALGLRLMAAGQTAWAGLTMGLLALTRPQLAFAVLAIGCAWSWWSGGLKRLLAFGTPAVIGTAALVGFNGWIFGRWSPDSGSYLYGISESGDEMQLVRDLPLNVLGTLVDPLRGVLFYYPALVIVALGLLGAWKASPPWVRAAGVGGLVALITQLSLNRYSGGDTFFGSRLTIEGLTLAYPLLVLAWFNAPLNARRLGLPLLIISVGLHAAGAVWYPLLATGALPRQLTLVLVTAASIVGCFVFLIMMQRAASEPNPLGQPPEPDVRAESTPRSGPPPHDA
jgi:hypothetical protein